MHNPPAFLEGGGFGLGGEFGDVAGYAVVEAGAEGDDEVGFLHRHVGIGGAVHAKHVEGLLVQFVESAEALEGCCDGDGGFVCQLFEQFWSFWEGDHALPGIDDWFLRDVDQIRHTLDSAI